MAKIKVYDHKGIEFDKEPVDARECVSILGWSLEKPNDTVKNETKPRSPNKPKDAKPENAIKDIT